MVEWKPLFTAGEIALGTGKLTMRNIPCEEDFANSVVSQTKNFLRRVNQVESIATCSVGIRKNKV